MTAPRTQVIRTLPVNDVVALDNRRPLDEGAVQLLMESIQRIGLLTPISFRLADAPDPDTGEVYQNFVLVTGRHRLEAFKRLGLDVIPAIERDCSERMARIEEITENLHRADLTVLQRSEQTTEWKRLWAEEEAERLSDQVGQKMPKGRPEGGDSAAARGLNLTRQKIQRAKTIANLSDEAKQTAQKIGLDDNQSALLTAAKHDDAEQQVETLKAISRAKIEHSEEAKRHRAALDVAQFIADHCKPADIQKWIERLKEAGAPAIAKALKQIG